MEANGLHGPIPEVLRNFTSIEHLDLSDNYFVSPIPSWFSELKSLTYLGLSENEFTTMASAGFWISIGVLWFKKNWRHAYFRWREKVADKIYVSNALKAAKVKKMMVGNMVDQ
ncbi:receptor-like protein EIX2 [Senna tora]|uniref:Receptor-like protein EIX2 n=1 Tax=Senna tora TaxID=362788 RepID=A0A834WPK5_9FABA|nr:receptor-like protein EIX2 [Senna tora]